MGDEDFDYIAKVLFNHPTIQAVMGAQDIQKKRKLLKRFLIWKKNLCMIKYTSIVVLIGFDVI